MPERTRRRELPPAAPELALAPVSGAQLWFLKHGHRFSPSAPAVLPSPPPGARPSRVLLFLDLDNTLINSSWLRHGSVPAKIQGPRLVMSTGSKKVLVVPRPGACELLQWAAARFDLSVFTASRKTSAEPKISWLDELAGGGLIDPASRFYRSSCPVEPGVLNFKDLRLCGRPLSRAQ